MKKLLLILFINIPFFVASQNISCTELLNYVEKEGYRFPINRKPSILSKWLGDVTAFSMVEEDPSLYKVSDIFNHYDSDGVYVIVAQFYSDDLRTKSKYVFCNVPISDWDTFDRSLYLSQSRNEMFNKYIMKYRCNCY
jgi:hypothetical protein